MKLAGPAKSQQVLVEAGWSLAKRDSGHSAEAAPAAAILQVHQPDSHLTPLITAKQEWRHPARTRCHFLDHGQFHLLTASAWRKLSTDHQGAEGLLDKGRQCVDSLRYGTKRVLQHFTIVSMCLDTLICPLQLVAQQKLSCRMQAWHEAQAFCALSRRIKN